MMDVEDACRYPNCCTHLCGLCFGSDAGNDSDEGNGEELSELVNNTMKDSPRASVEDTMRCTTDLFPRTRLTRLTGDAAPWSSSPR